MSGRHLFVGHLVHGLMKVRIELFAGRLEPVDAVLGQRIEQVAFGELDALDQRLDAGIGAGAHILADCLEGAADIIGDVEQVAREG